MSNGADLPLQLPARDAAVQANARALAGELAWLQRVLQARLAQHFSEGAVAVDATAQAVPPLADDPSDYAALVREAGLGLDERLVLVLALAPHVQPQLLDLLFVRNPNLDRGFTEFGGWRGKSHSGFLPSLETAAFVIAGPDLARRFTLGRWFEEHHPFCRQGILRVVHDQPGEPWLSGALQVSSETLSRVTTGEHLPPDFSGTFPAKRITTRLGWDDLVLDDEVLEEVRSIETWIRHGDEILAEWQLGKALKPGYRSLFFGPPGTGKTLTATLIGQAVGADVYRIDLSMVVSKFIGETEKNLAQVFDQAQNRRWILFFDEADALFGKRTATSSSNDRHANQEVSYLLQRVEDFPGTVILATNLKSNIDEAFARRFQSLVHFPMPDPEQRLRLWQGMLQHSGARLADDVDLALLAEQHELAGGAIANVVRFGAIHALQTGRQQITAADLRKGVTKELRKEGRTA